MDYDLDNEMELWATNLGKNCKKMDSYFKWIMNG